MASQPASNVLLVLGTNNQDQSGLYALAALTLIAVIVIPIACGVILCCMIKRGNRKMRRAQKYGAVNVAYDVDGEESDEDESGGRRKRNPKQASLSSLYTKITTMGKDDNGWFCFKTLSSHKNGPNDHQTTAVQVTLPSGAVEEREAIACNAFGCFISQNENAPKNYKFVNGRPKCRHVCVAMVRGISSSSAGVISVASTSLSFFFGLAMVVVHGVMNREKKGSLVLSLLLISSICVASNLKPMPEHIPYLQDACMNVVTKQATWESADGSTLLHIKAMLESYYHDQSAPAEVRSLFHMCKRTLPELDSSIKKKTNPYEEMVICIVICLISCSICLQFDQGVVGIVIASCLLAVLLGYYSLTNVVYIVAADLTFCTDTLSSPDSITTRGVAYLRYLIRQNDHDTSTIIGSMRQACKEHAKELYSKVVSYAEVHNETFAFESLEGSSYEAPDLHATGWTISSLATEAQNQLNRGAYNYGEVLLALAIGAASAMRGHKKLSIFAIGVWLTTYLTRTSAFSYTTQERLFTTTDTHLSLIAVKHTTSEPVFQPLYFQMPENTVICRMSTFHFLRNGSCTWTKTVSGETPMNPLVQVTEDGLYTVWSTGLMYLTHDLRLRLSDAVTPTHHIRVATAAYPMRKIGNKIVLVTPELIASERVLGSQSAVLSKGMMKMVANETEMHDIFKGIRTMTTTKHSSAYANRTRRSLRDTDHNVRLATVHYKVQAADETGKKHDLVVSIPGHRAKRLSIAYQDCCGSCGEYYNDICILPVWPWDPVECLACIPKGQTLKNFIKTTQESISTLFSQDLLITARIGQHTEMILNNTQANMMLRSDFDASSTLSIQMGVENRAQTIIAQATAEATRIETWYISLLTDFEKVKTEQQSTFLSPYTSELIRISLLQVANVTKMDPDIHLVYGTWSIGINEPYETITGLGELILLRQTVVTVYWTGRVLHHEQCIVQHFPRVRLRSGSGCLTQDELVAIDCEKGSISSISTQEYQWRSSPKGSDTWPTVTWGPKLQITKEIIDLSPVTTKTSETCHPFQIYITESSVLVASDIPWYVSRDGVREPHKENWATVPRTTDVVIATDTQTYSIKASGHVENFTVSLDGFKANYVLSTTGFVETTGPVNIEDLAYALEVRESADKMKFEAMSSENKLADALLAETIEENQAKTQAAFDNMWDTQTRYGKSAMEMGGQIGSMIPGFSVGTIVAFIALVLAAIALFLVCTKKGPAKSEGSSPRGPKAADRLEDSLTERVHPIPWDDFKDKISPELIECVKAYTTMTDDFFDVELMQFRWAMRLWFNLNSWKLCCFFRIRWFKIRFVLVDDQGASLVSKHEGSTPIDEGDDGAETYRSDNSDLNAGSRGKKGSGKVEPQLIELGDVRRSTADPSQVAFDMRQDSFYRDVESPEAHVPSSTTMNLPGYFKPTISAGVPVRSGFNMGGRSVKWGSEPDAVMQQKLDEQNKQRAAAMTKVMQERGPKAAGRLGETGTIAGGGNAHAYTTPSMLTGTKLFTTPEGGQVRLAVRCVANEPTCVIEEKRQPDNVTIRKWSCDSGIMKMWYTEHSWGTYTLNKVDGKTTSATITFGQRDEVYTLRRLKL